MRPKTRTFILDLKPAKTWPWLASFNIWTDCFLLSSLGTSILLLHDLQPKPAGWQWNSVIQTYSTWVHNILSYCEAPGVGGTPNKFSYFTNMICCQTVGCLISLIDKHLLRPVQLNVLLPRSYSNENDHINPFEDVKFDLTCSTHSCSNVPHHWLLPSSLLHARNQTFIGIMTEHHSWNTISSNKAPPSVSQNTAITYTCDWAVPW